MALWPGTVLEDIGGRPLESLLDGARALVGPRQEQLPLAPTVHGHLPALAAKAIRHPDRVQLGLLHKVPDVVAPWVGRILQSEDAHRHQQTTRLAPWLKRHVIYHLSVFLTSDWTLSLQATSPKSWQR